MPGRDNRIAIVTVHGTGDTAPEPEGPPDGPHWFQTKSKFVRELKERLAGQGVEADVSAHLWSGANSASERDKGARALAQTIRRLARQYDGRVHVIGHSHGGNVANDAAVFLNWSRKRPRRPIASITTVGTPFFRSHATASDQFGAWVFALVVVASLFLIPTIALFAGDAVTSAIADLFIMPSKDVAYNEQHLQPAAEGRGEQNALLFWLGVNALPVASATALLFMFPLAFRGIGRIRRASRRANPDTTIYSLWHPNDEAIAFLSRLESVPIEPFPRWSLFRGSRTGGILWGVRAIIIINLIGAALLAFDVLVRRIDVLSEPFDAVGVYFLIVGLAGAPVVFAAFYLIYRMFAAMVLELSMRGMLNNAIGGALKAIAFGRDGDHRIDRVATCSHTYAARREVLGGAVAERMLTNSAAASQRLFDKYRASLFSVEADETNAVNQLTQDSMTWDSLIHTTYFDQPEVVNLIGDYIAAEAKEAQADA